MDADKKDFLSVFIPSYLWFPFLFFAGAPVGRGQGKEMVTTDAHG
jgi:hypothetical protein